MTLFFSQFGMREKMACFELCVSPVLIQNQHIWNYHGSLILDNGEDSFILSGETSLGDLGGRGFVVDISVKIEIIDFPQPIFKQKL